MQEWTLPSAASMGSSVRCKGVLNEIRSRLPIKVRKSLKIRGVVLVLEMSKDMSEVFEATTKIISEALVEVETLPVIPRELEDILAVSTTERHRWLKDGRLRSAGTRTVRLHGRAKKITFHVFDPRQVEDILDRDLIAAWREDDAIASAERKSRAAATRALIRKQKNTPVAEDTSGQAEGSRPLLKGWEDFEREGLLR
jgi:hypothetical protein